MKLPQFRMKPSLTPDEKTRREMAAKYWEIRAVPTVQGLADAYGVSKPTLLKYAYEFPPEYMAAGGAPNDPWEDRISPTEKALEGV